MAHVRLPDFIITKKRKRSRLQAVDPCLGFYPMSSSPRDASHCSPSQLSLDPHSIASPFAEQGAHISSPSFKCDVLERSESTHDICRPAVHHTEPTAEIGTLARAPQGGHEHEVETALTVEKFLRSAAAPKATKRYSNWRRRRSAMKQKRQIEWTSDDEEYVSEAPHQKRQRRKKTRPLSARILAAAVVTGVDVVGGPLFRDPSEVHTSTMRPLPMSLGNRAPSPVAVGKSRCRRFVDPRKVDRADSQFVRVVVDATVKKGSQAKEPRPITAWEPEGHAIFSSSVGRDTDGSREPFATRPLTLVSSTHPRSALRARCTTIISRSCPIFTRRQNQTCRSERHGGGPLKSSRAHSIPPLQVAPSPPTSAVKAHGLSPSHNIRRDSCGPSVIGDHAHIALCHDANLPPTLVTIPSSPPRSTLDSNLDEVWASRGSQKPKSTHKLDLPIALCRRSAPPKPLKSLVSLLDGLREIARNATQVAAEPQACQPTRLRPATSSSKGNSNPVRSAAPSCTIRARNLTEQPLPPVVVDRPVASGAQMGIIPTQAGDSLEGGGARRGTGSGNGADSHPDTHRVDVLAILQSNQRKVILLPSSPLPGWNALPSSAAGVVRDDSDSEDNSDDY